MAVGSCHRAEDPAELAATLSDTAPPVPCTAPHQTETIAVLDGTPIFSHQAVRPNPELLNAEVARVCNDYTLVRDYLDADPSDNQWGISVLRKLPTPAEWAAGDRTVRCEAVPSPRGPNPPLLTASLRGALRRTDSARFRHCRVGGLDVTCDLAHDAEATSPDATLGAGSWPGSTPEQLLATSACTAIVGRYLGGPLERSPTLVLEIDLPTEAEWNQGRHSARCWIGQAGAVPATGTLRAGLR
jgi:hypothetical protein